LLKVRVSNVRRDVKGNINTRVRRKMGLMYVGEQKRGKKGSNLCCRG